MNDATMIDENKLINADAELAENNLCKKCGNYCPSGVLPNGLCSDCDLIGKTIYVLWGRFGSQLCEVSSVSRRGTIYAKRWNKKWNEWTKPRSIKYYRGIWTLKN